MMCRNEAYDFDGVGAPWLCLLCLLLLSGYDEQYFGAGCRPASGKFGFPAIWPRVILGKLKICFDGRPLRDQPPKLGHEIVKQLSDDGVSGGPGHMWVSRPPTHVTAVTCHPPPQPILPDYTFCSLFGTVQSQ